MSATPFLSFKTINVPAWTTMPLGITGATFVVKTASFPFTMNFDGGEDMPMDAGWSLTMPAGQQFGAIIVKNLTASPLTFSFYVGTIGATYSTPNGIKDASTFLIGSGLVQVQVGAAVLYNGFQGWNGVYGSTNNPRRQFVISNLDAANTIIVTDQYGNAAGIVPPMTSWTLAGNGVIGLSASGAANAYVNCVIAQTFYS